MISHNHVKNTPAQIGQTVNGRTLFTSHTTAETVRIEITVIVISILLYYEDKGTDTNHYDTRDKTNA